MEKKTMGAFLAALRKTHGYTQQEIADKLNISNKTVSKWERDEGCPEIMMLPAIAELYGVTVDEILRGERILKEEAPEINEEKTEKRAKYLFDKAQTKFTNLSFVSIALGVLASILAYLIWEISYNNTTIAVCVVLTLIMTCASIIVQIIALNNFMANFNSDEGFIDEYATGKAKKKALIYLCVTICLATVSVFGIVMVIINASTPYAMIPVSILFGGVIAFAVYSIMFKKIGVDKSDKAVMSPEFLVYRRKHIKRTLIVIAVVIVACTVFPFAAEVIDSMTSSTGYSFLYSVGYDYDSVDEAENDYNKLKDFFLKGEPLYNIEIDMSPVFYVYELTANCYNAKFDDEGQVVSAEYEIVTAMGIDKIFDTVAEAEAFRYNECWNHDILNLYDMCNNVSFDDETMTVRYSSPTDFTLALDIFPVFLFVGSLASIAAVILSCVIYLNKRRKSTRV